MQKSISKAIEDYKKQTDMTNVLEKRWVAMYQELLAFKIKNGHANVPINYNENKKLAYWVRRQRMAYQQGTINPAREELLSLIWFNFKLLEFHDWDDMYNKLQLFKKQFGHANPTENNSDIKLHNWLVYQRKLYWRGKLDYTKIEKLKAIGVEMRNKTLNRWEDKFAELKKFKNKNGHLHVCASFGADKELITFVKVLRRSKDTMPEERKKLLTDMGFDWNPAKTVTRLLNLERANNHWLKRYNELKQYKLEFGTSYIPTTSKTNKSLSKWISVQRNNIPNLSDERMALLNEIDFFEDNRVRRKAKLQ